jgi:alkane 1-monooxygenase
VYHFWFRSFFGGYFNAWKLESARISNEGNNPFSFQNKMVLNTIIAFLYNAIIFLAVDFEIYLWFLLSTIIGILLFETMNYVHHYGLFRYQNDDGSFEEISPYHSWNSNNYISRWFLFEQTRHSDHHIDPARPYQLLRHLENSPQLPSGMPGMILLALFPPSWFNTMDPKVLSIVKLKNEDVISLNPMQQARDTFDIR